MYACVRVRACVYVRSVGWFEAGRYNNISSRPRRVHRTDETPQVPHCCGERHSQRPPIMFATNGSAGSSLGPLALMGHEAIGQGARSTFTPGPQQMRDG